MMTGEKRSSSIPTFSVEDRKQLEAKIKSLREKRQSYNLFSKPIQTSVLFSRSLLQFIKWLVKTTVTHWMFTSILIPIIATLVVADRIKGPQKFIVDEIILSIFNVIWWVGLGILSSVGLGCGMHSGLLFLFPHIFLICASAENCLSLTFDSRTNMWGNVRQPGALFECEDPGAADIPTYFAILRKVLPYAFLWGLGTALGELPPYAASYATSKAQKLDQDFEELEDDIHLHPTGIVSRIKIWTLSLIENYGWISVFLLSCWPNVMFDLCGIVCGHFMMPFWKFFGAVFLGKAVVKAGLQAMLLVFLSYSPYDGVRAHIVGVITGIWPVSSLVKSKFGSTEMFENYLIEEMTILRHGTTATKLSKNTSFSFTHLFTLCTIGLIGYFVISCINQVAQVQLKEKDDEELEKFSQNLMKGKSN